MHWPPCPADEFDVAWMPLASARLTLLGIEPSAEMIGKLEQLARAADRELAAAKQGPAQGRIKVVITGSAADDALLQPHIYDAKTRRRLKNRAKDPADPLELVIVRDMWLTGCGARPGTSAAPPTWPRPAASS